jgi:hypothetical protein
VLLFEPIKKAFVNLNQIIHLTEVFPSEFSGVFFWLSAKANDGRHQESQARGR